MARGRHDTFTQKTIPVTEAKRGRLSEVSRRLARALLALGTGTLLACTPSGGSPAGRGEISRPSDPAQPSRTLVFITRAEPSSLAGTILSAQGIGTGTQRRLFNAALSQGDGESRPIPYLAESLPQLNSDSWRVFPDGSMETTYRLRPGLQWHDGTPMSAADFVFAHRIYTTPEYGVAGNAPHRQMEGVSATDDRTLIFRWRVPYPDAGALAGVAGGTSSPSFVPLPRHVLERVYEQERESLPTHAYWTTEFIGAGPYRLDRWEAGAFIEGVAFDQHVGGRPRIGRIRLIWNADPNIVLSTLLAGEAHVPADRPLRVQQGVILERAWAASGAGTVEYRPELPRFMQFQHRPEYASPQAVLDLRVRRALAHAIDRQAINESLYEGKGIIVDTLLYPGTPYEAELQRAVGSYPHEPRRSEQLMAEGGYTRGADGIYTSPSEGRLTFEIKVIASAQSDAERAIMSDGWRRLGFEFEQGSFSPAQSRDGQTLGTFRSLYTTGGSGGEDSLLTFTTASISRPETRWVGNNRGGWSNAEYDHLVDAFYMTLDRAERNRQSIQAWRILTEQLGVLPLYFNPAVNAYAAGLRGIDVRTADAEMSWNVHLWEF